MNEIAARVGDPEVDRNIYVRKRKRKNLGIASVIWLLPDNRSTFLLSNFGATMDGGIKMPCDTMLFFSLLFRPLISI